MAGRAFNAWSFVLRWIVALAGVLAAFNPSEWSYFHWVAGSGHSNIALKALAGLALAILFIVYLRATWHAIGPVGVILAVAFLGTCVWAMVDFGLLDPNDSTLMTWVAQVLIATVMAIGLSWSHIRRRVSGQLDVDETGR